MNEFYTLQEVAAMLHLPYEFVRDQVYAGRWPHTAFSPRKRRMSQEDVDRVVASFHKEPKSPSTRSEARASSKRIAALIRAV
jgi:excisionase family DNA binding protein